MPTKKYFLHRDLSFLFNVIKLYSRCKKWANELHKISNAILPLVRTLCFDHFAVENQIDAGIKSTAIRRQTICREPLNRYVCYWKRA